MNETSKFEPIQTVYPQYINAPNLEDEVNLVDVWIQLVEYKKVFFTVFAVLLLTGLLLAFFVFSEKYTLTSGLQIGSFNQNNKIEQIESTEALQSKLVSIFIPNITKQWLEENPGTDKFSTTVSIAKSSDVVLIQHKVKESEVEKFTKIQSLISSSVIENHVNKIKLYQADLLSELQLERIKLEELKDQLTLKLLLDKEMLVIQTEQSKLGNTRQNLEMLEQGGPESFLKSLNNDERELVVSNEGIVIDELLKLRFKNFLLENKIRQDEIAFKINTAQIRLAELEKEHKEKILRQELEVQRIQEKLGAFNTTQVVTTPVLSLKPTGLTRNKLILLMLFVSVFAGLAAMLLALFRDKVNKRREEMSSVI